ncbi:DUF1178 family protein [Variovorax sp. RHLX14]|uniref:DUF1178 family protein n=1 Tax=Variovorax sp. RHLX14 TaxID=1259731 RepID=UPI003F44E107
MKVLDLRCVQGHGFEGWFASGDAFESQLSSGLVECPVCGERNVVKLLAAPRLNLSGAKAPPASQTTATPDAGTHVGSSVDDNSHAAQWMRAVREVMARTEDVGERFADEARKMHYGETEERGIRGRATRAQAEALVEEGIDVMPLPVPDALKETLQ